MIATGEVYAIFSFISCCLMTFVNSPNPASISRHHIYTGLTPTVAQTSAASVCHPF